MNPDGQAGPTRDAPPRYRFDDVVVDLVARTVTRAGDPQTLEPKAFAVLALLLARPGELVGREELLDAVWGHRHVTPGVLTRVIAQLRVALGDEAQRPRYIQTRHALGYCFIGTLEPQATPAGAMPEPAEPADATAAVGEAPPRGFSPAAFTLAMTVLLLGALAFAWWESNAPTSVRTREASIAVRPFSTLSGREEDRYFAEGLAAEMHDALAGVRGLRVAAWTREAGDADAVELGRRLDVAAVLDASVQRDGERVRIRARLTDASNGFTLWARQYDRELADVFATQGEIAREVATALVGALPDAGEQLRRRLAPTDNVAAFDAYLRGLYALLDRSDPESAQRSLGFFRNALARDARFSQAQAGVCRAELWRFEHLRDASAFDSAGLACLLAERMDPRNGTVRLALGDLHRVQGDAAQAERHYRALLEDPAHGAAGHVGLAKLAADAGQTRRAFDLFARALALRPNDARVHAEIGYRHYLAGDLPRAIAALRRATELAPASPDHWSTYGALLLTAGRTVEATAALERAYALEASEAVLNNLATLKYQAGDYAGAARLYRQAAEANPSSFRLLGHLGDALRADPATASEAVAAYRQAAGVAARYLERKPDDALALAALGWYRANLGDAAAARRLAEQAEASGREPVEVAYYNAMTFAVLGDLAAARRRVEAARAGGIGEVRLDRNTVLRSHGLAGAPPARPIPPPRPTVPEQST